MTQRRLEIERITGFAKRWRRRAVLGTLVLPLITLTWWIYNQLFLPWHPQWWHGSLLVTIFVTPAAAMLTVRIWQNEKMMTRITRYCVGDCKHCGYDLTAFMPPDDQPMSILCSECGRETELSRPPNGVW